MFFQKNDKRNFALRYSFKVPLIPSYRGLYPYFICSKEPFYRENNEKKSNAFSNTVCDITLNVNTRKCLVFFDNIIFF